LELPLGSTLIGGDMRHWRRRNIWKVDGIDVRLPLAIILPLGLAAGAGLARSDFHPLPRWQDVPSITGTASVIDGDTIEIHGERIRLDGIDAPEGQQTCRCGDQVERCGQVSAWHLADMIGRGTVECYGHSRDRHDRLVAICRRDGPDLNGAMVEAGHAVAYTRYSWRHVPEERRDAQPRVCYARNALAAVGR
jgi:endonuclease YncB( thermonuclease family)